MTTQEQNQHNLLKEKLGFSKYIIVSMKVIRAYMSIYMI